ncbi:MAG: hypothetical protein M3Z26_00410 [Bacteroidota bacterium]|nr:hypothetical protein [Bacteroidota bacterium]
MPKQQDKILEQLQSIESVAEMILEKCYSVKQLLSPGGFNPRASIKKKSQSKINQVIANRNRSINSKAKKILFALLLFSTGITAQDFSLPVVDSLFLYVDDYYTELTDSETEEFKASNKHHWINYIPSPGYSPFSGGFTFSLNLSAPIQEFKSRKVAAQKINSIKRLNLLQANALKSEVYSIYKALENSINEYHSKDSLESFHHDAFKLFSTQYIRNELTPSDYISKKIAMESFTAQRIAEANNIYKSILLLLIKSKKPMHSNAPAY